MFAVCSRVLFTCNAFDVAVAVLGSSRCHGGKRAVQPAEGPGSRGDGQLPASAGGDPQGGGRSRCEQVHRSPPAQQVGLEQHNTMLVLCF